MVRLECEMTGNGVHRPEKTRGSITDAIDKPDGSDALFLRRECRHDSLPFFSIFAFRSSPSVPMFWGAADAFS